MSQQNLLIAVSGGRSSARMAHHIHTSDKYKEWNKVYVFCNTGMERPETIDFLKNIATHWGIPLVKIEAVASLEMGTGIQYKIVDWDNLNMTAEPFAEVIRHMNKGEFSGLPFQGAPYCSDYLKTRPSKRFADGIFGTNNYKTAIGFRKEDMPKRVSWPEIKTDQRRIFPLLTDFQAPVGQLELNRWWSQQPFQLGIHGSLGNCELCWKKSDRHLMDAIKHGTRFVGWWQEQERKYGTTAFRGQKSIDDLVRMASLPTTMEMNFEESDGCVCSFT
jgi:hypothetical protein